MNLKLILSLSLFGLGMAFGTAYFIQPNVEPFCWLPIFLICAYLIAKNTHTNFFLHGFLLSLVNYLWYAIVHILLSDAYLSHIPKAADLYGKMSHDGLPIAKAIILTSLIFGIISGIFLGLFATLASKFFHQTPRLNKK